MPSLALNIPSMLTKELRIQRNAATNERWVRLSSNLLNGFGFSPNTRMERRILAPSGGFALETNPAGAVKVYRRAYNHRRNRPCETVIDIKAQPFLDAALPGWAETLHFTIKPGVILARPQAPRAFHISRRLKQAASPFDAFFGMSSGLDVRSMRGQGFNPRYLVEFRPHEKRDSADLTETGVLTAVANNEFEVVFNEDIYRLDMTRVREVLADRPPVGLMHLCLQCDDHSTAKGAALKKRSIEDLTTTKDMAFPALRLIEEAQPGIVMIENVPFFAASGAYEMLTLTLRRWGYSVSTAVLKAPDFQGKTTLITPGRS